MVEDPLLRSNSRSNGAAIPVDLASDGTASLLLGNGNGTFQAPVSYTVGQGPVAVAARLRASGRDVRMTMVGGRVVFSAAK